MNGSLLPLPTHGTGDERTLPLAYGQQQLWFIDEFHHGLPAHNLPYQIGLLGQLDLAALRRALDELVARHPALRTRMPASTDGTPTAVIDQPGPVRLELADLAGLSRAEAAQRLSQLAATDAVPPFQLANAWPVRDSLVRVRPREHVLVLVVHQLAFDDASVGIGVRDLAALYGAEAAGRPSAGLAALPAAFADHTLAERDRLAGPSGAELEAYWRDALSGFQTARFPTDRQRPLLASHDGQVETI